MVKKKHVLVPILAVFCAALVAILSLFCLVPRKSVSSVSASSFSDVDPNLSAVVSYTIVYSDDTTYSETLSPSTDPGAVENGYSLVGLLGGYENIRQRLTGAVWIYVNFSMYPALDLGVYDFFVSDGTFVSETQAFVGGGQARLLYYEEVLLPLPVGRYYRLVTDTLLEASDQLVWDMNIRLTGAYFQTLLTAYEQGYLDYYFFIAEKTLFMPFDDIYNKGYEAGNDYGYNQGYNQGYAAGEEYGNRIGYNNGYNAAIGQTPFTDLLGAVFDVPVQTFLGLTDFEILGVNMSNFLLSLMTICLFVIIFRKLI